jgi:hypothetical protein
MQLFDATADSQIILHSWCTKLDRLFLTFAADLVTIGEGSKEA